MGDGISRGDLKGEGANLNAVDALMRFVTHIGEPASRTAFLRGERTSDDFDEIPESLRSALKVMSECELAFLARLRHDLDAAELYDEYNPKLYYF